jgi:hypothetical protein
MILLHLAFSQELPAIVAVYCALLAEGTLRLQPAKRQSRCFAAAKSLS